MKKLKLSLMIAFFAMGITAAFAFKASSNFSCSGPLFFLNSSNEFEPVNTSWDCLGGPQICIYYEDEEGEKRPCDEPLGQYTVIIP